MELTREQNVASYFVIPLIDASNRPDYKAGPTLTAGDVKVIRHTGGSWNVSNIGTLPSAITGATTQLLVTLTATELNPDDNKYPVIIQFVDQTDPKEWDDQTVIIWTRPVVSNVTELDGGAQSLTDLKDFADAGYDPATNKVEGVKLVDTTTTNTDLSAHDSKLDTVDTVVDAIKAVTDNLPNSGALTDIDTGVNNIEAKLPTNYIMGSGVQTDKDDEIDAIKAVTDNLPNSGALTDIDTGINNIEGKLPTNYIMGSSVQTDKDDEIDAIKAKTDNLPADPASETNVDANEAKIDIIDTNVDAIKAKTDNLPADPASETNVDANETKIDAIDTVVDAIKAVTDNLPNSGALTDIDTGVNNIEAKLPTNYIMGSSVQTDKDDEIDAIKAKTDDLAFTAGNVHADIQEYNTHPDVDLADDAITAAKFDETTAYPLKSDDSGSTQVARTGADADTLETLSDQIDGVQTSVDGIQNNTNFVATVPQHMLIPDSGDTMYKITVHFYDSDGNMEDPDSNEIDILYEGVDGTDKDAFFDDAGGITGATAGVIDANMWKMVRIGVGHYETYYKLPSTESPEQWTASFKLNEASTLLQYARSTNVVDETPGSTTLADNTTNADIIAEALKERDVSGVSAVSGSVYKDIMDNIDTNETKIDTVDTVVDAIKAKTDNLPADPASETNVDANETKIDAIDTVVDAIKAVTDNLPNSGALTDIDTGINNIEAKLPTNYIMGSSVQTDKDDEIDAIKAKTDNLPADPASETNVDANEAKIDIIDTVVDAIKVKTDNLPVDPASETNVDANEAKIDIIDTVVDAIKLVTDNLPNSGSLTDIDTGINNIEAKLPTNYIMGSSVQSDKDDEIDSIKSTVEGLNDISAAEVNAEVDQALIDINLDHLLAVADADDVVDNSVIAKLAAKGATADWSTFDNTTNSLEAITDDLAVVDATADAIKAKTDNLPADPASETNVDATEVKVDAIKSKTDQLAFTTGNVHADIQEYNTHPDIDLNADQSGVTIGTVNALGAQAKLDVNAEVDTALSDYDGPTKAEMDAAFAALNDLSAAEVNTEVDTALADIGLDHLISASVAGADVADDSIIAQMVSKSGTADWDTFDNTTDSLEAIRDNQIAGGLTQQQVRDAMKLDATGGAPAAGSVDQHLDDILSNIGTPVALDGGSADLAGMLTKIADDNGGADFDATTDSLHSLQGAIIEGVPYNEVATAQNVTNGTVDSGDYTDTHAEDGTYFQLSPNGSALDVDLTFDIDTASPVDVSIHGRYDAAPNRYVEVYAWDYDASAWEQISSAATRMNHSASDQNYTYTLLNKHKDPSTGEMKIRFLSDEGSSGYDLYLDSVFISAVVAGATPSEIADAVYLKMKYTVYAGAIHVDTNNGTAGTEVGVNGIPSNPVDTLADALTLAGLVGVRKLVFVPGSSVTLSQAFTEWELIGYDSSVALNSQNISRSIFRGMIISGTATAATGSPAFIDCEISTATLPACVMKDCQLSNDVTLGTAAGDYFWDKCFSGVAGTSTPAVTFAANANLSMRHYSGGIEIKSMAAGSSMSLEGDGQYVINASCTGGTLATRGNFQRTDNASGAVTESDVGRMATDQLDQALVDINLDHLLAVADADDVVDDSVIAKLAANGGDWSTFDDTTDSLEAVSDKVDTVDTVVDAIKAKTDNLPADPASETNVDATEVKVDAIKAKTDNLNFNSDGTPLVLADIRDVNDVAVTSVDDFKADASDVSGADVNVTTIEGADATNQIVASVDASIESYGLDHLVAVAVTGTDVADDSIIAQMVSKSATPDYDSFDNTTDSLEALRDNQITPAQVNAECDTALADYDGPTKTEMDNSFAALNDISAAEVNAEVDTALADYDGPTKTEMDAAFAALNDISPAEVNAEVDAALADYDGPTKAEMDAAFAALNDISAAEVNAECDQALADYDGPTNAEMLAAFAALNDISPAEVNAEVDTALADYDGPTKAEMDAGFAALNDLSAAEVNAEVDQALIDYDSSNGVAKEASVLAIQNNTRFVGVVPNNMLVPDSGDTMYRITAHFYDLDGNMEDPDNNEIAAIYKNVAGTSKTAFYDDASGTTPATSSTTFGGKYKMIRLSQGVYQTYYKLPSTEPVDQWIAEFSLEESTTQLDFSRSTNVVEENPGSTTLADNTTNKTIMAEALKEIDVNAVSAVSGSIYDDIMDNIDDNEAKIDIIDANLDSVKSTVDTNLDTTVSSRSDFDETTDQVIVATNNDKTGYELADNAITNAKIATDAIGSDELALSAVQEISNGIYAGGFIYLDTSNGSSGTTAYVNGTPTNPVDSLADAMTLAAALDIYHIRVANGSSIVLNASLNNYVLCGESWTLDLNGQNIGGSIIIGADFSGAYIGTDPEFRLGKMGTTSGPPAHFHGTMFSSDFTITAPGDYFFDKCYSGIAGTGAPSIDFGALVGGSNVNFRSYSGGVEVKNMGQSGTDNMSLEGWGQFILNANCVGGTIAVRGHFKKTDNSGGAVTVSDEANFKSSVIHSGIAQGSGTGNNQIQLSTAASSTDGAYDPAVVMIVSGTGAGQCRMIYQYAGSTKTATVDRNWKVNPDTTSEYRILADPGREHVNEGLAQGGAASSITLNTLASGDDDAYNGQIVFVKSGTGEDQARIVIDYNGTTKVATVDAPWDTVPDSTSAYVMLPAGLSDIRSVNGSVVTSEDDFKADVSGLSTFDHTVDNVIVGTNNDKAGYSISGTKQTLDALNDVSTAEVNAEVDQALVDINLDHLLAVADADDVVNDSVIAKLAANGGDWSTFDDTTDSLEAISDSLSGSGLTQQQVRDAMTLAPTPGVPAAGSVDEHLDDILTDVASVQADVTTIDGKVDTLQTDVTTIDGKVDSIQTDVTTIDGKVDGIQTDVTAIDGKIDVIDGNVDDIEAAIGSPISLDSGTATVAGMLIKMADDAGGANFDSTNHSLEAIGGASVTGDWSANEKTEIKTVLGITNTGTPDSTPSDGVLKSIQDTVVAVAGDVNTIETNVGNAISLDGGTASLAGMLTKMADNNNGADYDASIDSMHEQTTGNVDWTSTEREQIRDALGVDGVKTIATGGQLQDVADKVGDIDTHVDDVLLAIGTPISLDGGGADIAGMLTKMADDNNGLSFDASNDSLNQLSLTAGGNDWNASEKEQIRDALGVDGTKLSATGGQVQGIASDVSSIKGDVEDGTYGLEQIKIAVDLIKAVTDLIPDGGAMTSIAKEATLGTPVTSIADDIATVLTEITGVRTEIDNPTYGLSALKDAIDAIDTGNLLDEVLDGSATVRIAWQKILAYCAGNINRVGKVYTYRNYDNTGDQMVLTSGGGDPSTNRTRS